MGRASARALAQAGADVIVHYGKGADEAASLIAEIRAAGGTADGVGTDLASPDGPAKLSEAVKAIVGDKLDIVVANVGVSGSAAIEDQTIEKFDNLYAVNSVHPTSWSSSTSAKICIAR
ncbi:MAG: SDR family NAD(P)-dependent oxidoreductase [Methylocella sp.]